MFGQLDIFRTAGGLARHATLRQGVIAENIANADTPGYTARDVTAFADMVDMTHGMRRSRPGHLGAPDHTGSRITTAGTMPSTNGNSVAIETEMFKAIEVRQQYDRALAIYRNSLALLRASLGRR
jgi:flagellar basal-body rod protein FlgB